ncbi:Uncharacterised protein [Raoultella planticola]|uniref:Uncharacterized protein n=1 Tax=Raoultella planticola TaxID=575 RepID=A0A485BD13_RAOPL|nr:Uncharacterised protein [Raoultella planticola]
MNDKNIIQMPDGYLNKNTSVPVYFVILLIPFMGMCCGLK